MARVLSKRLISGIIILVIFVSLLFFLIQIFLTGDFVLVHYWFISEAEQNEIREGLGLDRPIHERYFIWLGNLFRGDLGDSFLGFPVGPAVWQALKRTLLLLVPGVTTAFLIGNSLGKSTAWRGAKLGSDLIVLIFIVLYAFFPPSMAFLMRNIFLSDIQGISGLAVSEQLISHEFSRSFPDLTMDQIYEWLLWSSVIAVLLMIVVQVIFKRITRRNIPTWLALVMGVTVWFSLWAVKGYLEPTFLVMKFASIPLVGFILLSIGDILIVSRESMIDTVFDQYLVTARAKGLDDALVREKHASRNAILPVMSKFIISLPFMLTGLTIIEASVGWPGIGTMLYNAVDGRDIPLIMGCLLVIGVFSLAVHLLLDFLLTFFDPRLHRPVEKELGARV